MLRRTIAAFLSTLVLSTPALGAPPSKETPAPASLAEQLKRAERARNARRWDEAVAAYQEALAEAKRTGSPEADLAAIYIDAGTAALEAGQCAVAGNHFNAALDLDTTTHNLLTPVQRKRADNGGAMAFKRCGVILVSVDPPDAAITIDGSPTASPIRTLGVFAEPGEHHIRASHPGYTDAAQTTTVVKSRFATITMSLAKIPPPLPPAPPPVVHVEPRAAESDTSAPPFFRGLDTMSLGLSLAPLIGFGVTPGTSIGGSLDATYRYGSFSANAEVRIVGSQVIERDDGIRTIRGEANLSGCGHASIAFFCGLVGWSIIDVMEGKFARVVDAEEPTSGSLGLRTGIEWRFSERLALRPFAELSLTMGQPAVWVDHERYWLAPPVAGIFGIGMVAPLADRTPPARPASAAARRAN